MGWYDNEWGCAHRPVDLAGHVELTVIERAGAGT